MSIKNAILAAAIYFILCLMVWFYTVILSDPQPKSFNFKEEQNYCSE